MNKMVIFISCLIFIVLMDIGFNAAKQVSNQREALQQLETDNVQMKDQIAFTELLPKSKPFALADAYALVMDQIRMLQAYSGTNMNVQLENIKDSDDISSSYVSTVYKGVEGLKIKIIVDKFSKETDMGAVLDDIHLLEKNTDFMATEITKDNNDLIVKGEIYGL